VQIPGRLTGEGGNRVQEIDLTLLSRSAGGSDPLRGYLFTPDGDGPWPGLVMIHEAFGFDDVMRRHAERLAAAGYLTLAVDLYSTGGTMRCLISTLRAMSRQVGKPFADIDAARRWLGASEDCTGRIGSIGFCMGGGFALLTADIGFDAAAVNYGPLPKDLDGAVAGVCPIVASYGGKDRTQRGAAERLERSLAAADIAHDVKEYPDAGHAFLNDAPVGPRPLRPRFKVMGIGPNPASAPDAWRRIEDFLATHLRPGGQPGTNGAPARPQ
jgi:carboxymethylenebutenolidase